MTTSIIIIINIIIIGLQSGRKTSHQQHKIVTDFITAAAEVMLS